MRGSDDAAHAPVTEADQVLGRVPASLTRVDHHGLRLDVGSLRVHDHHGELAPEDGFDRFGAVPGGDEEEPWTGFVASPSM